MAPPHADPAVEGHAPPLRAFAIEPQSLEWFDDPSRLPDPRRYVHAPALEVGFRRVAEQLPSERIAWFLRFSPIEEVVNGPDVYHFLFAEVIDLHAPHCCVQVAVELARNEDGWSVLGVADGGYATETEEYRKKRLAKGAEVLR